MATPWLAAALMPLAAHAQTSPGALPNAAFEQWRQHERLESLRQEEEKGVDVRRPVGPAPDLTRLAEKETPCFDITRLRIDGDEGNNFPWLAKRAAGPAGDDAPVGRCLGGQGINLVLRRLQNALIAEGYVTTRVVAKAQDLTSGVLAVTVQPGRIGELRFAAEGVAPTSLRTAFPISAGDILNLRDIEQALENLKRLPTADADIRIEPGKAPGESDLVIVYRKALPWRATLTVDDGGTKATGKYQGSATLAYDNPFGLNDQTYLSLGHDLGIQGGRGTDAVVAHYSVPYGYWTAGITYNRNRDHQTVAGAFQSYVYRGVNSTAEAKLSRLVYRDGVRKTTLSLAAFRRASRNYIDDTEVEVQRRVVGGWALAANHREFIGAATLDATVSHKRGTGAFGAISAPEEAFGEGTSRFRITSADIGFDLPFAVAGRAFVYRGNWRGQWNHTRLTPQDMFFVGGRYSVRGFDGEMALSGERGWVWRNELATSLGVPAIEGYVGADVGAVAGPNAERLAGKRLAGAVVGIRGEWKAVRYEAFAGAPLYKPAEFRTARVDSGIRLAMSF